MGMFFNLGHTHPDIDKSSPWGVWGGGSCWPSVVPADPKRAAVGGHGTDQVVLWVDS